MCYPLVKSSSPTVGMVDGAASEYIAIISGKLTFDDRVPGIVSRVSQRICIFRLVKRIFLNTSVLLRCYFAFHLILLAYRSPVCESAAECHLQLLERQVYSVARLCPDQSFLSLCHRRRVAGLSMLYDVKFEL